MLVKQFPINPTYKKENGLWVLNIDSISLPFTVVERSIVYLPPKQLGGNHRHFRQEAFIAVGQGLKIVWRENDEIHELAMNPDAELMTTIVSTQVEHAVINTSEDGIGVLFEFADGFQNKKSVIACNLVEV